MGSTPQTGDGHSSNPVALPRKRGTGIHQTLLITPSQPQVAKTRSR